MLPFRLTGLPLLLICALSGTGFAQATATPAATVITGPVNQQQPPDDKVMTREERIKQHHERIEKIIQDNRKKTEDQQKAAAAAMAAASSQNVGNTTASSGLNAGGAALPTGPIQPATMAPPIQKAARAGQSQSPQAARSESRTILMFDPMDSVVNVGDTFETKLLAETKTGTVDAVSFLLKYSKDLLNPLALDHHAIDSMVDGAIEYAFDPDAGEIYFRAQLKSPTRFALSPLVSVTWEALEPTDGTSIGFRFDPERQTGLFANGTNLLGTLPNANDGIIRSTVMIRAPKSKPIVEKVGDGGLVITSKSLLPGPPTMQLRLVPSEVSAREGQEFSVKVMLDNEGGDPLDRLRLVARFNPTELEVVDMDHGNQIRSGTNIEDGLALEQFPFDFSRTNEADNVTGTIVYDVAAEVNPVRGSGVVAVIHLRAKKATEQSAISLQKGEGGTEVSYLHSNMLAPTFGPKASSVLVSITPDPEGRLRAAANKKQAVNPFRSRLGTTMQTD